MAAAEAAAVADEETDAVLSIPLRAVTQHLECAVCYELVNDCRSTPCGHNFCQVCISECLNRKKRCPMCNADVLPAQLVPNRSMDNLVSTVRLEKRRAQQAYYTGLFKGAGPRTRPSRRRRTSSGVGTGSGQSGDRSRSRSRSSSPRTDDEISPIGQVLRRHLKSTLVAHEAYYQDLGRKFEAAAAAVKDRAAADLRTIQDRLDKLEARAGKARAQQADEDAAALRLQLAQRMAACEDELSVLQKSWDASLKYLVENYDRALSEQMPPPDRAFAPVTLNVELEAQPEIRLAPITIRATDGVADVRPLVVQRLEQAGHPLRAWQPWNRFGIRSLLDPDKSMIEITDETRPIMQFSPENGSTLVVIGALRLASLEPKQCFATTFDKTAAESGASTNVVDYFQCKSCGYNWICQPCAVTCHKDHDVSMYLPQHRPTWACCYCYKKNASKCKLRQSASS